MSEQIKRLYLSNKNKQLAGVCGGIAEYFEMDATLIRLAWVGFTFLTGILPGILAYIVAMIIMPKSS